MEGVLSTLELDDFSTLCEKSPLYDDNKRKKIQP